MVELTFVSRATHFVPLALLRYIAEISGLPSEIEYIGETGFKAIKGEFCEINYDYSFQPCTRDGSCDKGPVERAAGRRKGLGCDHAVG